MDPPPQRETGITREWPAPLHLPVHACHCFFRRSARLAFGSGGGAWDTASGVGFCTVGGCRGASQGCSPARRTATPSRPYSLLTCGPSFLSIQPANPGPSDTPYSEALSTTL